MEDGKIRDVQGPPVALSDLDIFQDDPNQYNFDSVPDFIFSEEDIIDPINSSLFEYWISLYEGLYSVSLSFNSERNKMNGKLIAFLIFNNDICAFSQDHSEQIMLIMCLELLHKYQLIVFSRFFLE